jgi:transposase
LTQENRDRIKELLSTESPEVFGYNTRTWTGPIVIDWIMRHMDVCYQKAQIYNIIKSLGFSYQKSRGFYPEADPVKQEEFKEALKKTS